MNDLSKIFIITLITYIVFSVCVILFSLYLSTNNNSDPLSSITNNNIQLNTSQTIVIICVFLVPVFKILLIYSGLRSICDAYNYFSSRLDLIPDKNHQL